FGETASVASSNNDSKEESLQSSGSLDQIAEMGAATRSGISVDNDAAHRHNSTSTMSSANSLAGVHFLDPIREVDATIEHSISKSSSAEDLTHAPRPAGTSAGGMVRTVTMRSVASNISVGSANLNWLEVRSEGNRSAEAISPSRSVECEDIVTQNVKFGGI